jgi:drug/metabolite transporter (DMT)-like permease
LRATVVVAVLSGLVTTPAYLLVMGLDHLHAAPLGMLAFQGLAQGGLQGAFTMLAYAQAVVLLGVSRAVLFPALVPGLSVLIGIPMVGEIPSLLQISGLVLVTLGLLTTIGLFRRLGQRIKS